MNRRLDRWRHQAGLTLIELLIALVIVGTLAAVGIPGYLGFLQRAREVMIIQYLREVHNGQVSWRIETDENEFTGDFDELEETGFIPGGTNFVKARTRVPRKKGGGVEDDQRAHRGHVSVESYSDHVERERHVPVDRVPAKPQSECALVLRRSDRRDPGGNRVRGARRPASALTASTEVRKRRDIFHGRHCRPADR